MNGRFPFDPTGTYIPSNGRLGKEAAIATVAIKSGGISSKTIVLSLAVIGILFFLMKRK